MKKKKERSELAESPPEEVASMVTHMIGTGLSITALVLMIVVSIPNPWAVVSGSIFGASLTVLYLSSTLYHSFTTPKLKSFFQIIDHSAIYLLIAGTYTPVCLVILRESNPGLAWSLFGIVWGLAIGGVVTKCVMSNNREHWLSTALYVFMGWLVVLAIKPIIQAVPSGGLWLIVAGGLSYTLGVIFFVWHKLKFHHAIWHLFVIGGSACHALAMIIFILPG